MTTVLKLQDTWSLTSCTLCTLVADGNWSTSAGLKNDRRLAADGEVIGLLPLEKLDVDVLELLDTRLSMLLALSSWSDRGACCVSANGQ